MAVYTSDIHNFHKAMAKAGIVFPATKAEIIRALGDQKVQVDFDAFVPAASLVERIIPDTYENAAAFYNAYFAAAMVALKKTINY
ncbi:MAG: hypothetical protein AB7D36_03925 [Oscillospiraceae bacterium]